MSEAFTPTSEGWDNCACYRDMHKDVFGCRPTAEQYTKFRAMTLAEQDAELVSLSKMLDAELDREAKEQAEALLRFTKRVCAYAMVGVTNDEALLKIAAEHDIDEKSLEFYGLEVLEYNFGMKFGVLDDMFPENKWRRRFE